MGPDYVRVYFADRETVLRKPEFKMFIENFKELLVDTKMGKKSIVLSLP